MWPIDPSLNCLTTEADRANAEYPLLSALFHFGLSITDENGTEILKEFRGPLQAIYSFTIEPNGYVKQTLIWNSPTGVGSTLPRGAYQIRGIFHGAVVPGFKLSTLETPSITFTIK